MKKQDFKKIKTHTFAGNKYKIIWRKPRECEGLCDPPQEPGKKIHINPNQTEKDLLKTALDEAIHACNFSIDNDYVYDMSDTIGEFLYRMGFRLKNDSE